MPPSTEPDACAEPEPTCLRYPPRRAAWDGWLQRCRDVLFAHGSELVATLPGTDNVADAERILRWATEAGLIRRKKNTPTREQAFFDQNGDAQRQGWITSGYSPGPTR